MTPSEFIEWEREQFPLQLEECPNCYQCTYQRDQYYCDLCGYSTRLSVNATTRKPQVAEGRIPAA